MLKLRKHCDLSISVYFEFQIQTVSEKHPSIGWSDRWKCMHEQMVWISTKAIAFISFLFCQRRIYRGRFHSKIKTAVFVECNGRILFGARILLRITQSVSAVQASTHVYLSWPNFFPFPITSSRLCRVFSSLSKVINGKCVRTRIKAFHSAPTPNACLRIVSYRIGQR